MRKLLKLLLALALMLGVTAYSNAAESKKIKIRTFGWEDVGPIPM